MKKVLKVIQEAALVERKRRQASRKKKIDETTTRTQRAKALIADVKRGGMGKEEIARKLEEIFGKGSRVEIEKATTKEKIAERIAELSKREQQF